MSGTIEVMIVELIILREIGARFARKMYADVNRRSDRVLDLFSCFDLGNRGYRSLSMRQLMFILSILATCLLACTTSAQDKFSELPGHDRYQQVAGAIRDLGKEGRISSVAWENDCSTLKFQNREDVSN
jgi:hypothetical protein